MEHDSARDPVVAEGMGVGVGGGTFLNEAAARLDFSEGWAAEIIFAASTRWCVRKRGVFDKSISTTDADVKRESLSVVGATVLLLPVNTSNRVWYLSKIGCTRSITTFWAPNKSGF